jgi:hypothetical protein
MDLVEAIRKETQQQGSFENVYILLVRRRK